MDELTKLCTKHTNLPNMDQVTKHVQTYQTNQYKLLAKSSRCKTKKKEIIL